MRRFFSACLLPALALVGSSAAAAPRYSEIVESALPAAPPLASSPQSVDEGSVPWLQVNGIGPPTVARRAPGAKGAKPPARSPVVVYENLQLMTADGCLRVLTPGRESEPSEVFYLSATEALVPMQHERVVSDGKGGARLEIAQAWVDLRSRQSVAILKATAPLTRLLPTMNGLDTWAMREPTGLRVLVANAPEAIGDRRGMLVNQTCALTVLSVRNEASGSQVFADLTRTYFDRLSPSEPELSSFSRSLRLTASLSRLSRDPEPVLSVGLRFSDNLPPPSKIEPPPKTEPSPPAAP